MNACAIISILIAGSAWAQGVGDVPKDVVRGRLWGLENKHEVKPVLGVAVSDAYRRDWLLGVSYTGHISDSVGISVRGLYALGVDTALTKAIRSADPALANSLTVRNLQLLATAEAEWTPIYGKFLAWRRRLFHYDTSIVLGAGVSRFDSVGFDFAWTFGAQARIFFTRAIGVELGLRDYVLMKVDPVTGGKPPFHNLVFSIAPVFLL